MTVIIPIAHSDSAHLEFFTSVLDHFGPYPDDSALILPTPEMASDPRVARMIDTIANCFGGRKGDVESGRAVVQVLQNDLQRGWPIGGNMHFENAVYFMAEFFPEEPFLWMETDCYGITPYWLTTLKQAYQMAGTPYLGWTEDSFEVQTRAGHRTRVLMEGKHMAGPGIYPAGYGKRVGPGGAPNVMWKTQDRVYPFTIAARWEHRPVQHSTFICHKPRTVNWHIDDRNEIQCMDAPGKDPLDVQRAGTVDLKGVVFVHGPKDGSLANLILSGQIDQFTGNRIQQAAKRLPAVSPDPKPQAPPQPIPITTGGSTVTPEMGPQHMVLEWVNNLNREWKETSGHTDPEVFLDQLTSGLEVARRHILPVRETKDSADTPSTQESEAVKIVRAKLAAGNIQLAALAKEMGRDKGELKQELLAAGFTFNGTPQWVKLPAA
jgi:hypothetical protein